MLSIALAYCSLFVALTSAQSAIEGAPNLPDSIRNFPSCYNTAVANSLKQAKCSTDPINRETFRCMCNLPSSAIDSGVVPDVFASVNQCYLEWFPAFTTACANLPPYGTASDEDVDEAADVLRTIIGGGGAGGASSTPSSSSTIATMMSTSSDTSASSIASTESSATMESASQMAATTTAASDSPASTAANVPSSTSSGFGAAMATIGLFGPAIAALAMLV